MLQMMPEIAVAVIAVLLSPPRSSPPSIPAVPVDETTTIRRGSFPRTRRTKPRTKRCPESSARSIPAITVAVVGRRVYDRWARGVS